MKYALIALLLSAFCGNAQTIKTLGYNTTNGNVVAARTNLTFTNSLVDFQNIAIQDFEINSSTISWGGTPKIDAEQNFLQGGNWTVYGALGFNNTTNAATTRTNLSLGQFKDAVGDNWAELYDNGELRLVAGNTIIFFEAFDFGGTNAANFREQSRTSLGLGATWLTNTDAASFRTAIGLGTAATNPSTAFQPSSAVLTNLAANNGGSLTNLTAANIVGTVGLASNITGTAPLASNVTGIVALANGGTGANSAGGARTSLGATTVGANLFTLANPSAIRFLRINADNTASALSDSDFRTAIGLGTAATSPSTAFQPASSALTNLAGNNGASLTNIPISGVVNLQTSLNTKLATNGSAAGLTNFPTLNQNTTGTASNVTGVVAVANGGTGANSAGAARTNLELGWSALTNPQSSLASGVATRLLGYTSELVSGQSTLTGHNIIAYTNTNSLVVPANIIIGGDQPPAPRPQRNVEVNGEVTLRTGGAENTIYKQGSIALRSSFPVFSNTIISWSGSNTVTLNSNYWNSANVRSSLGLGATWLTNTNAANFRSDIGLGFSSSVQFDNLSISTLALANDGIILFDGDDAIQISDVIHLWKPLTFDTLSVAATTRTNLGLGATNNVTFSNVTVNGALSVNTLSSVQTSGSGPTQFNLALPANTNVLRLTGIPYYIQSVSGGRLGAFYYLINETGSDLEIRHGSGISVHGGQDLVLGPNQAATLIATGANTASVASRGGLGPTNNVTFNNITANGSANTAPNQTIASGSSIITRDLMFTAQTDDPSGDLIPGANATGTSGFPAQAGTHIVNGLFAQVTTNANGSAGAYFVDDQWTHANYSGGTMPANKAIDMTLKGVMLRVETNQNWVLRVVAGVGTPNRVPPRRDQDALSARGWGVNFFYNGTNHVYQPFWYTTNYNVGPQTVVSNLSDASWLGRVYTMRMRQETNGDIKFWINDGLGSRLTSTPSWQTNVTWGATTFGGRHMAIEAASATNAAPAVQARIHYRVGYIKYEP